jgi:D-alanyl-D-alanine carboxypeptidase/D-alanyl-D-alanine-endopeptidase (penicillin-binding protein 4)
MTVRPASETGGQAQVTFDPPGFVDVDGTVKTSEPGSDNVILALAPNGKRLSARVAGSVSVDSKLVRYSRRADDPQLLAGYTLKAMLEQAGIKVQGDVRAGTAKVKNVLVDHDSAPLSQLLYSVGKNSDNFYAEMIFKSISGELHPEKPAKSGDSAEAVTKWLEKQGLLDQGAVIKNGSGLYDANRVTTSMLANVIRWAVRDPSVGPEYVAQLAIGGVDGTLHKRFLNRRAHRAIRAKTGTLDDVIALSGVVYGPPGKSPIVFSVLCNKVGGKGATAREAIDSMVRAIYDKQWGGAD